MTLEKTIVEMKDLLGNIILDLDKAKNGNKAASQRVRTGTVKLEKTAKTYRKESIQHEKQKGTKKAVAPKKASTPTKAKIIKPTEMKRAKAKVAVAKARPRALAVKRPTAKLPGKSPVCR